MRHAHVRTWMACWYRTSGLHINITYVCMPRTYAITEQYGARVSISKEAQAEVTESYVRNGAHHRGLGRARNKRNLKKGTTEGRKCLLKALVEGTHQLKIVRG